MGRIEEQFKLETFSKNVKSIAIIILFTLCFICIFKSFDLIKAKYKDDILITGSVESYIPYNEKCVIVFVKNSEEDYIRIKVSDITICSDALLMEDIFNEKYYGNISIKCGLMGGLSEKDMSYLAKEIL